jgi:HSP20 family protein
MTQIARKGGIAFPSVFSDFFNSDPFFTDYRPEKLPAVNVKDAGEVYPIDLAAPGYKKDDFHLEISNGILTLKAEVKNETEDKKDNYTRKEFHYSSFSRSFQLPDNADSDKVTAKYEDGILKLEISKKNQISEGKKRISVF